MSWCLLLESFLFYLSLVALLPDALSINDQQNGVYSHDSGEGASYERYTSANNGLRCWKCESDDESSCHPQGDDFQIGVDHNVQVERCSSAPESENFCFVSLSSLNTSLKSNLEFNWNSTAPGPYKS